MMKRLLAVLALLVAVCSLGRAAFGVHAAPSDFAIASLNCAVPLGDVFITTSAGGNPLLGNLAVVITPPGGSASTILVNPAISPAAAYAVSTGSTIDLLVGTGATQAPNPANNPLGNGDKVALTTAPILVPGSKVDLIDAASPGTIISSQTCSVSTGNVLYVSPFGFDFIDAAQTVPNTQCTKQLPPGTAPTASNPGACLTLDNALKYAVDGVSIFAYPGVYEVCHPIEISKLVRITTRQTAFNGKDTFFGATLESGDAISLNAIFHSFSGDSVFHVTAVGYPDGSSPSNLPNTIPNGLPLNTHLATQNHVAIDGLRIGGAFKPGAAAIVLDNDAYTTISNDWIGGDSFLNPIFTGVPCTQPPAFPPATTPATSKTELFGNSVGILMQNSDHAQIWGNQIQGTSQFKYSPLLSVGDVRSGFGIATAECLGMGPDASNGVSIGNNTLTRNVNAGIWLCSDGGGGHLISSNAVRGNGRGIVLRAITGSLLDTNTITDDYEDGIVIYDAASNNTVQKNVIESHRTPGAAGIRLGGFGGSLFPLQTNVFNNTIRRNYTGLIIAGARTTSGSGNVITSEDIRTAVLLQVGATGSPSITQPSGTALNMNQIVSNGPCGAAQGCAIRLDQFVASDMDATNNNFGLSTRADVNSVLWHKPNDPMLGFIVANQATGNLLPAANPAATVIGAPGAVGNGLLQPAASPIAGAPGAGGAVSPFLPTPPPATATPFQLPPFSSATPAIPGTSPVLTAGLPGGSTTYGPPCSYLTVPAAVGASITAQRFLSQFQPVSNIFSAFRVDNATKAFQALYFANAQAPVDASVLKPGDIVSICVTDNVVGPP